MRFNAPIGAIALCSVLAACGPTTPEEVREANVAKCERQFGRMAPDPAKGNALCTCLVDSLAEQGLEITDMLGPKRAEVESTTRSCARRAGIALPT